MINLRCSYRGENMELKNSPKILAMLFGDKILDKDEVKMMV
jgi:hypothetical protein